MTEIVQPEPAPPANMPDGRWPKGRSGNPAGRPKGSLSKSDKIVRALNDDGPAVVRVVIDAALAGDMQAAGHVLSRIAPALRSQSQMVQFNFDPSLPIGRQVEQVLAAVAAGEVPPDTGQQIITMVGTLSQVRAVEELEQRVVTLEARAL